MYKIRQDGEKWRTSR